MLNILMSLKKEHWIIWTRKRFPRDNTWGLSTSFFSNGRFKWKDSNDSPVCIYLIAEVTHLNGNVSCQQWCSKYGSAIFRAPDFWKSLNFDKLPYFWSFFIRFRNILVNRLHPLQHIFLPAYCSLGFSTSGVLPRLPYTKSTKMI